MDRCTDLEHSPKDRVKSGNLLLFFYTNLPFFFFGVRVISDEKRCYYTYGYGILVNVVILKRLNFNFCC
mgnify:CR=1 FL=1